MSRFTEQHEKGVRAFTESLEHKQKTCSNCEFEDSVLHSEWTTHVETTPKSGHIRYKLTCPDCDSTEIVEIDI
ncbi:hypothetical protein BRD20_10650 [Halobacteriales archaeon SW_8_65_20]|nr:MAG: hypothetical protein BRD20_10650 [Halobacteriales archaeon SW_8_65_20]